MDSSAPFAELTPRVGSAHCAWVLDSLVAPSLLPVTVGFRVPSGFESILRLHHRPADSGTTWRGLRELDQQPHEDDFCDLEDSMVDALLPTLEGATGTPELVHFAQWLGWGDLIRGSSTISYSTPPTPQQQRELDIERARYDAAQEPIYDFVERCAQVEWWGGRTMFLFDGPIDAVTSVGSIDGFHPVGLARRAPQWWWPADRAWFVATEIDDPCTYIAGSADMIDRVERLGLDTRRVEITDSW